MVKCTVAIPVYNRVNMVGRAIDSALRQDGVDLEILVVDNCSIDGTWEAIQQFSDSRVRLVRNESNIGLFGNFNRCLELAQGDYLRFLCSDDELVTGCLSSEIAFMDANPSVAMLNTRGELIAPSGKARRIKLGLFAPGVYSGRQATRCFFHLISRYAFNPFNYPSGMLFRRERALAAGGFDPEAKMTGDIDYFLRVLRQGEMGAVKSLGCRVMLHGSQEGSGLFGNPIVFDELFALLHRYAHDFSQSEHARIEKRLASYPMVRALQLAARSRFAESRQHIQIARQHASWLAILVGLVRVAYHRSALWLRGSAVTMYSSCRGNRSK